MKSFKKKFSSVWGPTLAICMAIVVSSAVTATAASVINGKNIKNKTVAGTKLKNNTITGTQVKESKLGRVPLATRSDLANQADNAANAANAAKIEGASLSGLVQGGGHSYSAVKHGATNSNNNVLLTVPGIGRVEFNCAGNGIDSTPYFVNTSGQLLYVMGQTVARDGTPSNTDEANIAPNVPGLPDGASTNLQSAQQLSTRTAGTSTFQVWSTSGDAKRATFVVSSIFCSFTASAETNQ